MRHHSSGSDLHVYIDKLDTRMSLILQLLL